MSEPQHFTPPEDGPAPYEYRVIGPPGCGKTTWLTEQVNADSEEGKHVLVTSLTKAAAAEVNEKNNLYPDQLGTLHSHAFNALGNPQLAHSKSSLEAWNAEYPEMPMSDLQNSKGENIDKDNITPTRYTVGAHLLSLYQWYRARRVPMEGMTDNVRRFAGRWEQFKRDNGTLDYTDLIALALQETTAGPGNPDVIYADESQDFDFLEMALLRRWGEAAGSLVLLGDPDQNLYSFRGSDPRAFTTPTLPPGQWNTLEQSYRVPRAVQRHALNWVNRQEDRHRVDYRPRDAQGQVLHSRANWRHPEAIIPQLTAFIEEGKKVMILASASFLLDPSIDILRFHAIPFHNPQRLSNGRWNPIPMRSGTTNAAQRLNTFLKLSETGAWSAADLRIWSAVIKTSEIAKMRNAKAFIEELQDDDTDLDGNPALSTDVLFQLFPNETLDAAYAGDLDWYESHLTSQAIKPAAFPIEVARSWGPQALSTRPSVVVGTCHCSPPDEPILTTNGWVPIGDLDPDWHKVAGHHRHTNSMTWGGTNNPSTDGFTFEKSVRPYNGQLITISSECGKTRVTPNHIVPVRFNDTFNSKYCCYLMRRGDWWRIGTTTTAHRPYKAGGVPGRVSTEQADSAWILSIHETKEEAILAEARWQGTYGIPGLTFEAMSSRSLTVDQLAEVHTAISPHIQERINRLFEDTGLQKDAPLYVRGPQGSETPKRKILRATFHTAAGNLLPLSTFIDVLVPHPEFINRTNKADNKQPSLKRATITAQNYEGPVYGLDVPPYHHYV